MATLERPLATISSAHSFQGLPSPKASPLVRMTMRGIRPTHDSPQRRVAAAVKEDVLAMVAGLGDGMKDNGSHAWVYSIGSRDVRDAGERPSQAHHFPKGSVFRPRSVRD